MSPHPELEQLSAYVDAELEPSERAALEAHLPSCAECRSTLDALRATIADLRELPEIEPTEKDLWALRAAIARARTPAKRWQRAAWAAGAVAAAAIAVVAIVQPGGTGSSKDLAARGPGEDTAQSGGAGAAALINYDAGSFDAGSAQAKLLVLSGKVPPDQLKDGGTPVPLAAPAVKGATTPTSGAAVTGNNEYSGGFAGETTAAAEEIDRCVAEITKSTQAYMRPVEYDVGTFESKPAFLLFFQTESRYEVWVVQRPSCDVLYFAQAA